MPPNVVYLSKIAAQPPTNNLYFPHINFSPRRPISDYVHNFLFSLISPRLASLQRNRPSTTMISSLNKQPLLRPSTSLTLFLFFLSFSLYLLSLSFLFLSPYSQNFAPSLPFLIPYFATIPNQQRLPNASSTTSATSLQMNTLHNRGSVYTSK